MSLESRLKRIEEQMPAPTEPEVIIYLPRKNDGSAPAVGCYPSRRGVVVIYDPAQEKKEA